MAHRPRPAARVTSRLLVALALGALLLTGGPGVPTALAATPTSAAAFDDPPPDSDGDGLPDDVDACPGLPGPYDGCPLTDLDGDGVYDDGADQCPNEPGPADNQGCPYPDSDGDGIPDTSDGCPNEYGAPEYNGCPYTGPVDSDGDGIEDQYDGCPNEYGAPEYNGCPYVPPPTDSDGDGVYDDTDQCPNEYGSPEYNGCPVPDSDGDGLPDDVDACPDLQGPYDGCPLTDLDGDGVYDDGSDLCPNEAGPADNQGCPYPDEDGDGVTDDVDGCPGTPQGEGVDSAGCSLTQLDSDNDGVNEEVDQCDDTPDGDVVDGTGCTVTEPGDATVTPAAVTFEDRCGATRDTMTVPSTEGVVYLRGTKELQPGTRRVNGKVVVTARAEEGYVLEGATSWTKKFTSVKCPKGEADVSSPSAGRVKVVNREDAVLRFQVGSNVRLVQPGDSVVVTTRSGKLRWSARWNGLFSPRTGFVRVG